MKRWPFFSVFILLFVILAGCATLDEKQRDWIFQPSNRSWGASAELARSMQDVWIDFSSSTTGRAVKLHGLWLPADAGQLAWNGAKAPVLLYLHGARWNVEGSAKRMQHMQQRH